MNHKKKFKRAHKSNGWGNFEQPSDTHFHELANCIMAISTNIAMLNNSSDREHACQTISVQLRKLLLDKKPLIKRCYKNSLKFHPLSKVALTDKPFFSDSIKIRDGGHVELHGGRIDGTSATHSLLIKSCSHSIEIYPLPGLSYDEYKKEVTVHSPFKLKSTHFIGLDEWLNQKIVSVHEQSMTLLDAIKTIADKEGAHADERPDIHMARACMFMGYNYFHWIVIFTASYLIERICSFKLHSETLIRSGLDIHKICHIERTSFSDKAISYMPFAFPIGFYLPDGNPASPDMDEFDYSMKPCQ